MKRGAIHFASGLSLGLVLMSIRFSYMVTSESRAAMLRRPVRYDTATHLGAKAAPPDKLLLIQEHVERIQEAIKPVQLNDKEQHHGRMIYSKTCLKRALKKKTKNWFSRPIIA